MVFFGKACARGKLLCKMTHVENGVRNRGVGVSGTPCFWNTVFSIWSSSIIIHFYDSSILWEYSGCFLKLTKNIDTVFFPHFSLNPDADHQVWFHDAELIAESCAYNQHNHTLCRVQKSAVSTAMKLGHLQLFPHPYSHQPVLQILHKKNRSCIIILNISLPIALVWWIHTAKHQFNIKSAKTSVFIYHKSYIAAET